MQKPTKEEIARTDRIHRRVNEANEQLSAGHIITECIVLHPDEDQSGKEAKWTLDEVRAWPAQLPLMLKRLNDHADYALTLLDENGYVLRATSLHLPSDYDDTLQRGRVVYRGSAVFLAVHPAPDPYTPSDLDRAVR